MKKGKITVKEYIDKYNIINKRGFKVTQQAVFNWIYRYETINPITGKKGKKPPFEYTKDATGIWISD